MSVDWKDIGKRTGKTFLQAFIGAVSIECVLRADTLGDAKAALISALMAGISAGVCAVWNTIKELTKERETL